MAESASNVVFWGGGLGSNPKNVNQLFIEIQRQRIPVKMHMKAPHIPALPAELDKALEAGDNETAKEVMTLMELEHERDSLEDEELALQIMEEELKILVLEESLQHMALDDEQEKIQVFNAMEESKKESESKRPPASPVTSTTPLPCMRHKPVAKAPAVCP